MLVLAALGVGAAAHAELPGNIKSLFEERLKSVVAVEYFVQAEIDRSPATAIGLIIDEQGTVVMLDNALPDWVPPSWFRDFRIHVPGIEGDGEAASYLGMDFLTGWHFLRIDDADAREQFEPITGFGQAEPQLGAPVWGIGVMHKNFDFKPYFRSARVSQRLNIPWEIAVADSDLGAPGAPVFDAAGAFLGWLGKSQREDVLLTVNNETIPAGLRSARMSSAFLTTQPFLDYYRRIPRSPAGEPQPWIGVAGLQVLEREAAGLYGLENQGAIVVSDLVEGAPAEVAGLQSRDVIIAVDGEPLRKYAFDPVVTKDLERLVLEKEVGDTIELTVMRGPEQKETLRVTVAEHPTERREAERRYFGDIGMTLREFTLEDALRRRQLDLDFQGVIASFVKPNSPAAAAGLERFDWVKEIDNTAVDDFAQAVSIMERILNNPQRTDFVILVSRDNETKFINVKLQ